MSQENFYFFINSGGELQFTSTDVNYGDPQAFFYQTATAPVINSAVNADVEECAIYGPRTNYGIGEPNVGVTTVSLMTPTAVMMPNLITEVLEPLNQFQQEDVTQDGILAYYRLQPVSLGTFHEDISYVPPTLTDVHIQQAPLYQSEGYQFPINQSYESSMIIGSGTNQFATSNKMHPGCSHSPFPSCVQGFNGTNEHRLQPIWQGMVESAETQSMKYKPVSSAVGNLSSPNVTSYISAHPYRVEELKEERTYLSFNCDGVEMGQQQHGHDSRIGNYYHEIQDDKEVIGSGGNLQVDMGLHLQYIKTNGSVDGGTSDFMLSKKTNASVQNLVTGLQVHQKQKILKYVCQRSLRDHQWENVVAGFLGMDPLSITFTHKSFEHDECIELNDTERVVAQALLDKLGDTIRTEISREPEAENVDHGKDYEKNIDSKTESDDDMQGNAEKPEPLCHLDSFVETSVQGTSGTNENVGGSKNEVGSNDEDADLNICYLHRCRPRVLIPKECNFDDIEIPSNLTSEDLYKISHRLIGKAYPFHPSWIDAISSKLQVPIQTLFGWLNDVCDEESNGPDLQEKTLPVFAEMFARINGHTQHLTALDRPIVPRNRAGFFQALLSELGNPMIWKNTKKSKCDEWLNAFGVGYTEVNRTVKKIRELTRKSGMMDNKNLLAKLLSRPKRSKLAYTDPSKHGVYGVKLRGIQKTLLKEKLFGVKSQVTPTEAQSIAKYVFRKTGENTVWDLAIRKHLGLGRNEVTGLRSTARKVDRPVLDDRCFQLAQGMVDKLKRAQAELEYPRKIKSIVQQHLIDFKKLPTKEELNLLFEHCNVKKTNQNLHNAIAASKRYAHLISCSD